MYGICLNKLHDSFGLSFYRGILDLIACCPGIYLRNINTRTTEVKQEFLIITDYIVIVTST